jgi:hypothetical protein
MKNKLRVLAVGTVAMAGVLAFSQNKAIQVTVNGTPVDFQGQGPTMRGDRVMVPLRGVLEQLGARVDWDPANQTVSAKRGKTLVRLTIGETTASVNGSPVNLDVPALIINSSTMVPLRFVGEALGDHVRWDSSDYMVMINTQGGDYDIPTPQPRPRPRDAERPQAISHRFIIPSGTVIPVVLDDSLNSERSQRGDTFSTTVQNGGGLPNGTHIEGVVEGARPVDGNRPGMLELRFDRVIMPDGDKYTIGGTLIGLDDRSVSHRGGRLIARDSAPNRAAFTGYGAGAGLVIGLAGHRPIEDAAIGALLGNAIGALQGRQVHNVHLTPGTAFGVRLNGDVAIGH